MPTTGLSCGGAFLAWLGAAKLVFGLDANTYEHEAPGKQDVLGFARAYVAKGLTSCWGDTPDPTNHTTYNARTNLQAHLPKPAHHSRPAAPRPQPRRRPCAAER